VPTIVFHGDRDTTVYRRYLTELDLKVANGELAKPKIWDPVLETLAERGRQHEQGFIENIKAGGLSVTVVDGVGVDGPALSATRQAMERGDAVIVQGALRAGRWTGRADVLRRVETPSQLGPWSYEVTDTKLAKETKANTVLQICCYTDMLSSIQGLSLANVIAVSQAADSVVLLGDPPQLQQARL
jgi:predicted RecB family nuclease